jgi:hypothetical protein
MKQEMMNVLFYIIKTRTLRNGEAPILLRVTIDGSYSDIRSLHTRLYEIHRNMVLQDEYFSSDILLKKLFNKETTKTVMVFFKEHNEDCRRRIGIDYAYSTLTGMITATNLCKP